MQPKFKIGDRVRYTGKKRYSKPIPNTEYNIISKCLEDSTHKFPTRKELEQIKNKK